MDECSRGSESPSRTVKAQEDEEEGEEEALYYLLIKRLMVFERKILHKIYMDPKETSRRIRMNEDIMVILKS